MSDIKTATAASFSKNVIVAARRGIDRDTYNKHVHGVGMGMENEALERRVDAVEMAKNRAAVHISWLLWTLSVASVWVIWANWLPNFLPVVRDAVALGGVVVLTLVYGLIAYNIARNNPEARYWSPPLVAGVRGI